MFLGLPGLGLAGNYLLGGTVGAGSVDGLDWAGDALDAWDFLTDQARFNSVAVGPLANTPGWSFTRASTGYAQTAAGVLVPFASGELRRTDKGVLMEGAGTNLCLESQTFDNASWTKLNATVTANQTAAPDGTLTADLLTNNTTNGNHWVYGNGQTLANTTVYTASIYLKYLDHRWISLRTDYPMMYASFDLLNGVVGSKAAGITAHSMTALGDGWYRCAVTWTTTGTGSGNLVVQMANGDVTVSNSYAGTGTRCYAWGAQLEATAYSTSYIPTTTASATRAADSLTVTGVTGLDFPLTLFCEFERASDTGATEGVFVLDSGGGNNEGMLYISSADLTRLWGETSTVNQVDLAVGTAASIGTTYKWAGRLKASDFNAARNGTAGTPQASGTAPDAPTRILFGARSGSSPFYGYLRRAAIYSRALTDAELQSLTT